MFLTKLSKLSAVGQGTHEGATYHTSRWCRRRKGWQSGQRRSEMRAVKRQSHMWEKSVFKRGLPHFEEKVLLFFCSLGVNLIIIYFHVK